MRYFCRIKQSSPADYTENIVASAYSADRAAIPWKPHTKFNTYLRIRNVSPLNLINYTYVANLFVHLQPWTIKGLLSTLIASPMKPYLFFIFIYLFIKKNQTPGLFYQLLATDNNIMINWIILYHNMGKSISSFWETFTVLLYKIGQAYCSKTVESIIMWFILYLNKDPSDFFFCLQKYSHVQK